MSRRKKEIKYKKERVILSDTLPYEIPLTFSNRHFYEFIYSNHIEVNEGKLSWDEDDDALDCMVKLIFGLKQDAIPAKTQVNRYGKIKNVNSVENINGDALVTIPFSYKISHRENAFRELSICHPRNQIAIIDFYNRFKETILYYCGISPFSIRHPRKLSKYSYHADKTHYESLSDDSEGIEEISQEYDNLRSFFVYKEYSNIHKFFESYNYHRCEKKFNALTILDVTKCFDSIYTHSLSWAIFGKNNVKENIGYSKKTFSGIFDGLMQQLNYNETNGIIIGPEFSRIFSELILQSVDRDVEVNLNERYKLKHKRDYQIFRYVDDYFIFFNHKNDESKIVEQIQVQLKKYNLYLNENKALSYVKPIITEITMAKQRIARLLEKSIRYTIEEANAGEHNQENTFDKQEIKKGSIYINSKSLIIKFKRIIKECDIEYKDIMNYSLAIVERKSELILKCHHKADKAYRSQKQLITAIRSLLEFVFFIYSVSPRVNTTIKLVRILRIYISYLSGGDVNKDYRHLIFKDIFDNVIFILEKNKTNEYTQVETLYLLTVLVELGRGYWLDENILSEIFGLEDNCEGKYIPTFTLNYFSITVLLFYIRNKTRYNRIREAIEKHILDRFEENSSNLQKDCELILLLMDCISCPYLSDITKSSLLEKYNIQDTSTQSQIINKHSHWFTKWEKFNLGKELDAKQSQEVY